MELEDRDITHRMMGASSVFFRGKLSRQKSEFRRAQSTGRMTSASSGYATQVALRQATWATLRRSDLILFHLRVSEAP